MHSRNHLHVTTAFLIGILLALTFSTSIANDSMSPQYPLNPEEKMLIDFNKGLLTVSASNISLAELMSAIGKKVGFDVTVFGSLDKQMDSWSFSNLLLTEAIKKIIYGSSAIIIYSRGNDLSNEPDIKTVYLLGATTNNEKAIHFNLVEPTLSNQLLVDQIQPEDTLERVEVIDRLDGLADEITVNSLVFSLKHDPDPVVRNRAVTALEQIGGSIAATALEAGMGDSNSSVRVNVVQSLAKIQDDRTTLWLGEMLMREQSPYVRLHTVKAIAQKKGDTARIFLEAATGDSSSEVSKAAARLLELHVQN